MPVTQILSVVGRSAGGGGGGGGGPAQGGDGSPMTAGNPYGGGVGYTITPSTNGVGNPGTAYPGDVITWTISSNASQAGKTILWWVDNNAVPVTNWVENPSWTSYSNAGSVVLDGNGSASFSLTVVANPTHGLFRLYFSEYIYQGFVTHGYIGV